MAAGMKHTEPLQDTLYREMLSRIKETDLSVPYLDDGYWYYTRTEQGKSYPIYLRRKGTLDAPEEVYLDQTSWYSSRTPPRSGSTLCT
jgi:oligopeptidase B